MTRIVFIDADGAEHQVEGAEGLSVMEVLRAKGFGIEGECEGSLACATCHVWVDEAWLDRLEPVSDGEADMLDCAFHVRDNSRLSCQISISKTLAGLRLRLPSPVR
jgi:2Fe-2S ferredoxin